MLNTPTVLLQSKLQMMKEYLEDPRIQRAYKQMEDGDMGSVFLDLYDHAKVYFKFIHLPMFKNILSLNLTPSTAN